MKRPESRESDEEVVEIPGIKTVGTREGGGSAFPHFGQKRLSSGTALEQELQFAVAVWVPSDAGSSHRIAGTPTLGSGRGARKPSWAPLRILDPQGGVGRLRKRKRLRPPRGAA